MIYRAEHSNDFSQIDNSCLRDDRLSLEAVGLLAYMLTMSDEWEFSVKALAKHFGISEKVMCRTTKELRECGYISYKRIRKGNRLFSNEWSIHEVPLFTSHLNNEQINNEQMNNEQTGSDIRNINIKNINNKNIKGKEEGDFVPPSIEEVSAYCQERKNGIDPEQFISFYASKGWKVGKHKMVDWKACVRTWEKRQKPKAIPKKSGVDFDELMRWAEEEDRKAGGEI